MIRVLHVLHELRASGAEVQLQAAGSSWERHGVACDILATAAEVGPFAASLSEAGYTVHHLPFTGDLRFLRAYAALVRDGSYDVVHVQMERASFYLCAAARAGRAGVVRTIRNAYPFEGNLARRRRLQRRVARAIGTRFVAIGPTVAQNERERFANPTALIDNWIDDRRFVPPSPAQRQDGRHELGVADRAMAVATVGNCSPVKNHKLLLQAIARLDDAEVVWLHIGDEDEARSEHHLATELGVGYRCRFLGRTDPLVALHAADLYAMPSLYEGLGMATVEALATGLPLLLTDVPGNRDLRELTDRVTWCSTDLAGMSTALRSALAAVRSDDGSEHRRSQHESVAARHGLETGVSRYVDLYRLIARG